MKLTEAGSRLPKELLESAAMRGVTSLTPPQELAIKNGLLDGRNLVVASPTASGKTFIAEMAIAGCVIRDRKKAVYVAPMRALVSEKYEDFKKDYPFLRVAMSIGDLDAVDKWLSDYDIVFASTEKLDSLIRHGVDWLDSIGCVIFDEIHMLDDPSRGPTLEILITKMRRMCPDAQLIALSATVGNAREIAEWLGAGIVESDYRPVKLERGIVLNGRTYYQEGEEELFGDSTIAEIRVAQDTLHRKKQALVFLSTKRNAEASSERIAQAVEQLLTKEEKAKLADLGEKVLHALGKPTAQCERLARVVAKGAAFHHGGLMNEQRRLIEDGFKNNILKVMCSTTTLCLPPGEEILCDFEPKPIQELVSNIGVLTHKGVFKKVITPTNREYTGELFKIKALGQLPMKMTPEHRVLISRRQKHSIHSKINKQWYTYSEPEWVEVKYLKKGDLALFPKVKENQNIDKIELRSIGPLANQCGVVGKHWSRLDKASIELDENGLEALGLFIAEGYTGKNGIVRFAISTKEQILTEKIEKWLKSLGLSVTVKDFERHRRIVNTCSKQLAETLRELFGTHAENKRIPQGFIKLPEKKLIPLVRGMWLGDGSVSTKKNYGCAEYITVSKVLAKQLFVILVKMGYMPSMKYTKPSLTPMRKKYSVNITSHRCSYRISISGKQLTRFAKEVLSRELFFQGNRTYNFGHIDENYYYMPVQTITTENYSGKVYNLEVEDDASYVCSFIVHNSMGVNLPAHTVLVRDTSRYSESFGSEKLSVNEVTQLFGRAGRPKYDKEGRALLIAKAKYEIMDLYSRYIAGELEPVSSKLGVLPVLRTHLLAFISTRMLRTKESMLDFLGETLYGHQFANTREMDRLVTDILRELESWKFVQRMGSAYEPTRLGGRVSELYIDPLSAKWLIDSLPKVSDDVSYLFMICNALEMRPYVRATEEASELFFTYANLVEGAVAIHPDDPLRPLSTALMLRDWISEVGEREVVKKYNTTPGALFSKLSNSDWIFYATAELARLVKVSPVRLIKLRLRAKYGIREELLDLIRLEQVGRVRARQMYNIGIKRVPDLRAEGAAAKVERLFGKEIAKRIMEQVT